MKIIKNIPNTITCLNLLSGVCAIIASFRGYFDIALMFILFAAIFDFLDGFAARLLRAYSDMGKELDSLSDVVSFGVAPSLIMFNYMDQILNAPYYLSAVTLLLGAFSALRLARFNVQDASDENFCGLATPAAAILVASLINSAYDLPYFAYLVYNVYFFPIVTIILCVLLVSHIPMFSLKMKSFSWTANKQRYIYFIVLVLILIYSYVMGATSSLMIFRALYIYVLYNLVYALFGKA